LSVCGRSCTCLKIGKIGFSPESPSLAAGEVTKAFTASGMSLQGTILGFSLPPFLFSIWRAFKDPRM
jgi:hypothetical protein